MTTIPLVRFHELSDVPVSGFETEIVAGPDELKRLAEWAGVDAVLRLEGRVRVHPQSRTTYILETEFEADIEQTCVVTLQPLRSHIARNFTRRLHFTSGLNRYADKGGIVAPASAADDAPDEIESLRYDLSGPLREEFALAIDPYPRAPGVEFESPDDADKTGSPFTVLEKLKNAN